MKRNLLDEPRRGRLRRGLASLGGAQRRLSFAAFASLLVTGLGTGVRFLTQLALARMLGASAYGSFVVSRGTGELLAKLPNRGYQLTVVRLLPVYEAEGNWDRFRALMRLSLRETALWAVAGSAVAMAVATWGFGADAAMVLGLGLIPVLALVVLHQGVLQAMHRYPQALAISELVQPIVLAAGVAAVAFAGLASAPAAVFAYLGSLVVALALLQLLVRQAVPAGPRPELPRGQRKEWLRTARPMYVAQLSIAVLNMVDVLAVGAFLGAEAAGIYGAASRIAALSQMIDSGVESVSASHIAEAYGRRDFTAVQRIVDQGIRLSSVPTATLMLIAIPLGPSILRLLGEEFTAGAWVLVIMLAANVVSAVDGPVGFVVSLSGEERLYAAIMAVHAVAAIVLTSLAALVHDVELVALASMVVVTSWNVCLVVVAKRRFGVRCWPRPAMFRRAPAAGRG